MGKQEGDERSPLAAVDFLAEGQDPGFWYGPIPIRDCGARTAC